MHSDPSTSTGAAPRSAPTVTPVLSGDQIRAAVAVANVPALLMVVFQVTGDDRWLQPPYLPTRGKGLLDHDSGGLPEDVQQEIRDAAVAAITALQEGAQPAVSAPSPELMVRMMSIFMGEHVGAEYGEMLSAELSRRLGVHPTQLEPAAVQPPAGFQVVVIGTGVAGIAAAEQLEDMGVPYVILEKQAAPGGNWWQNTYPGAGVDTPSHLYSFSFAKHDWSMHFALRDDLQRYFERTLKEVGAQDRVRFDTEVTAAAYDERAKRWRIEVRNSAGATETFTANVLISAVGVLNRPKLPDLPGMDSFRGISFHSSEWPDDLDLTGKRVAVVGTGASSMQIVGAIAGQVGHLTIFQRSPQWVAPFEKFQKPISDPLRLLMLACPLYHSWYWLRLFWQFGDKVIEALRKDPLWPHPERAVNARNDGHREYFTQYIVEQLEDRVDLLDKVLPDYPPFGKRILLDNGWYQVLRQPNVLLVAEHVTSVTEDGLVSASGTEHPVDVVIWATGFDAARFVSSLDVRGIGGISLRETWDDDNPTAYLGISVPGFPNFFMLGGPNSFPGSGSFMYFMEVQMRYVRQLLTLMFEQQIDALDAREEASTAYNDVVDRRHEETVWTHPGMSTYYRNSRGRVVFVMPFLNVEYWDMVSSVDLNDYTLR